MLIEVIPSGPFETNAYIAACSETRKAAIIDPGVESVQAITHFVKDNDLKPVIVLLTHSHWDHIGDVAAIKREYQIPVCIHPLDVKNLENPGSDRLPMMMEIEGVKPDKLLKEGDEVDVGNLHFKVIHTPGHTPGGICFYEKDHNTLFSGDTLFQGSIGNLSFPTADPSKMWGSLDKLAKLPSETAVFPGHGPSTTIGAEPWLPEAKKIFGYA